MNLADLAKVRQEYPIRAAQVQEMIDDRVREKTPTSGRPQEITVTFPDVGSVMRE